MARAGGCWLSYWFWLCVSPPSGQITVLQLQLQLVLSACGTLDFSYSYDALHAPKSEHYCRSASCCHLRNWRMIPACHNINTNRSFGEVAKSIRSESYTHEDCHDLDSDGVSP